MDINTIAEAFINYYYTTFDNNRSLLESLYRDASKLTWEGTLIEGASKIMEKLNTLPFAKVVHTIVALDAQPSYLAQTSMLVIVVGSLQVDDGEHQLQFSQFFQLMPEGEQYYVLNDIFRLNYG